MLFQLLTLLLCAIPQAPDTLVVCPTDFQPALQAWLDYRKEQGHQIEVVPPQSAEKLGATIRGKAQTNPSLKTIVLVGDATGPRNTVPTNHVKANVNVLFGAQPEIATDNRYADVDRDGKLDLAIGRIAVDTPEELRVQIKKIIAYEQNQTGHWQQRINFVAGVGGFGQLVDKLIENTAKEMITGMIPQDFTTSMTYGSWNSPYCPDPSRFSETSIERFNEGCLFWVYIGHGATHQLDRIYLPDRSSYSILHNGNVDKIESNQGNPIALFLACSTGGFDHQTDCLAEEMLCKPQGPIAAISSTRVSMPYGMSVFSLGLTQEYFQGESETLGEIVLAAKQRLLTEEEEPSRFRKIIEAMGQSFSPKPELLKAELREHADLMHLLGDPLLRVKRPTPLPFTVNPSKDLTSIDLAGASPFAGKLTAKLKYERSRFRNRPPRRRDFDPTEFDEYQETYEKTQDLVCSKTTIVVAEGKFSTTLAIPDDASGQCVVQVFVEGDNEFALGSEPLGVRR